MQAEWQWLDGDIGRRSILVIDDTKVIVELSPIYLGRGEYTSEWYMQMFPWDNYYSQDFDGGTDMISTPTPIDIVYVKDKNGDEVPDDIDLDSKANHIFANLKKCAQCDRYYYNSNWVGEPQTFCDVNHYNMWEAAHAE